ncbi:hypothetical protein MKX08_003235 [Trichoderma sp. CBMAI-0020]|nr:hypothetical protein MKX08_003235 [Trichoderma sp. CBMAI-0020]
MQDIEDYQVRLQDMANELLEKIAAWSGSNMRSKNARGEEQVGEKDGLFNDDDAREPVSEGCCHSSRGRRTLRKN